MGFRFRRKSAEDIHYGNVAVLKNFMVQMLHGLDLVTDCTLAGQMYFKSRPKTNLLGYEKFPEPGTQYNIAFIICSMAIVGPYIIQYSSMMNAYFIKGVFNENRWNEFSVGRKLYLIITFTFFGLLLMPIIDCYMKFEAIILFVTLPFSCKGFARKVRVQFEKNYNNFFLLTFFEIESFEKQKKHTQLLFEDAIMLSLNIAIFSGLLHVPILETESNMSWWPIILQVFSTIMSILFTCLSLWFEARGMKEKFV